MKYLLTGVPPMKLMFDFVDYNIGKTLVLHANTKNLKMAVLKVRVFENLLFRKLNYYYRVSQRKLVYFILLWQVGICKLTLV